MNKIELLDFPHNRLIEKKSKRKKSPETFPMKLIMFSSFRAQKTMRPFLTTDNM